MHHVRSSLVALAIWAAPVAAQSSGTPAVTPDVRPGRVDPSTRRAVLTANPFAALATYFAGDLEVRSAPSVTLGLGASFVGIDDYNNYRAVDAKLRYYPNEKALRGFSVAATAGISTAIGVVNFSSGATRRFTRPSIGTELSYQWILGPTARFVVVSGVGVKRMLGTEGSFDPINIPLLPTARVNIGVAF